MSQQKEYSDLKKRALLAKKRMKMGYWQQLQKEREAILEGNDTEVSQHKVSEVQRARYIRDNNKSINNTQAIKDEAMYQKVKTMLDENEFILNPIGQLMDKRVYGELDEQNKHRYVLELLNKYNELRERYYKERKAFFGQ